MRKNLIVLLVAIATLVLATTSVGAQESYPVIVEYAVLQSMDGGDPNSYTLLMAQESIRSPQQAVAILIDPLQFVNLEHPSGAEGTIYGEYVIFDPELTFNQVLDATEALAEQIEIVYVGATSLPPGLQWQSDYTGNYWTVDIRENTVGEAISVANSVWESPVLPLSDNKVTCPTTVSMCLYQAWDGMNGSRAWHFSMENGESFTPPFPMEGSLFQISGVAVSDLTILVSRFDQMAEEVIIRDDPDPESDELEMVVFRIWVGDNPESGWIPFASFDFEGSVIDTGIGGSTGANDGVRVRETPSTSAEVLEVLNKGTAVTVIGRDEQEPAWLLVRYNEENDEGWIRNDLITLQEGFNLDDVKVVSE